MPHDDGRNPATGTAIHAVDITAADAAGLDVDQDITVAGCRQRSFAVFELVVLDQGQGFHA